MSARSMSLDVLVRLRDNLSGGLRRLMGNLRQLSGFARQIGIVGAAVAAISFMGPVREAAAFQQQLLDIAGTANLSGKEAFAFVDEAKGKYEELAFAIGQHSDTIAKGSGQMIAAGVDQKLIDASIGSIGKAATAANAEFADMASVGTALLTTLKVPADQLKDSMGALVISGKEGAFELKDMAKYFPTLTGQMAKFGVTGREAVNFLGAALQIAKKGTSDPAEAANNLKNFLSKILAPATIKNFKDAGVDIEGVMRDAAIKGINPIEAVMQKISKLTGVSGKEIEGLMLKAKKSGLEGADALGFVREQLEKIHGAGALGELFADQQVMDFLIPFLSNIDEYKRIKDEVAKATGAIIDSDFETQMQGLNRQLTIFGEIGTQAGREVGFAFGTWLPLINETLGGALKWMREFDKQTGGMVRKVIAAAGGGILFAAALGALGVVLPIVGAGLGAIGALLGIILSPLGIVLGLLAGGAYLVWKSWDSVAPYLAGAWEGIKEGASSAWEGIKSTWSDALPYLSGAWDAVSSAGRKAWDWVSRNGRKAWTALKSTWAQAQPYLSRIWQTVSQGASRAFNWISSAAQRAWTGISGSARAALGNISFDDLKLAGLRSLEGIVSGLKAAWEGLKEIGKGLGPSLAGMGENLKSAFASMGDTWNSLERLGTALGGLVSSLFKLAGFGEGTGSAVLQEIGRALGALGSVTTKGIELFAAAVSKVVSGLADLAEWANGGNAPDWLGTFPDEAGNAIKFIAEGVEKLWGLLQTTIQLPVLAWNTLSEGFETVRNAIETGINGLITLIDRLKATFAGFSMPGISVGVPSAAPVTSGAAIGEAFGRLAKQPKPAPANTNSPVPSNPGRQSSISMPQSRQFAAISGPARQTVDVSGNIGIKVEGPGKVTSASSDNSKVGITADGGRMVGRV